MREKKLHILNVIYQRFADIYARRVEKHLKAVDNVTADLFINRG